MKLDYKSDVQAAFHHFYQTMATHDLSILCFASNFLPGGTKVLANTMGNNRLPSWTGVSGRHLTERVTAITSFLDSPHFVDNDMLLHVPTKYYKIISVTPYDFGYFSPVSHDDPRWGCQKVMFEERSQSIRNSDSVEEETAFIDWAIKLQNVSTSFATHYYPSPPAQGKECASAMETRPLSLTEDCTECVLLPILLKAYKFLVHPVKESSLLKHPDNDHHHYYLPVFKKFYYEDPTTTPIVMYERYFAIGIYYLGTPYFGDLRSDDPNEILNSVFQGDAVHDEVKEFVIE
ncbi:hypothetical protein BDA99DRAFT_510925 [Phascolomyces articulosus]|uniref:Uncharacterized protein n=1 Tax=Phascolomyces articulosus TaxID=60185 RepID=A0AAD5K058_9FUNG|nr:hypothetical protein BDA99DRAFT_510925 [Phascolomyces articulosus]